MSTCLRAASSLVSLFTAWKEKEVTCSWLRRRASVLDHWNCSYKPVLGHQKVFMQPRRKTLREKKSSFHEMNCGVYFIPCHLMHERTFAVKNTKRPVLHLSVCHSLQQTGISLHDLWDTATLWHQLTRQFAKNRVFVSSVRPAHTWIKWQL